MNLFRHALSVMQKDLRVEWQTKEILLTTSYFGFLVILVFAFAFFRGDAPIHVVAAGIQWVALAFAGSLGLSRVFDREKQGDCIRALLLSPAPRNAVYLGKVAAVLAFMLVIVLVTLPSVIFFFSLNVDATRVGLLLLALVLGSLGYAIVGTLLSAMLLRTQGKDVLLAVVFYPLVLPVLIAGVKATVAILEPEMLTVELGIWIRLLAVFDVVFLVAALWVFEPLIVE